MRKVYHWVAIALAALLTPLMVLETANAGSRYATPPPLRISPDLAGTWSLEPRRPRANRRKARRRATTRTRRRNARRVYRAPSVRSRRSVRRRVVRRAPVKRFTRRKVSTRRAKASQRRGFDPALLPRTVSWNGKEKAGTIIVNTIERRLYLVMKGGKARRYAVGVGKPGFEWAGTHKVSRKSQWPDWRPPKEMIARERKKGRNLPAFMPGGPKNPLGARALYLGSSLYRIHGTNQDWSIGQAVSSGCIRMRNEDVMDLYDRVRVGQRVKVI